MDQMPIELRSPLRRFCFAGACFILVGLYLHLSLAAYLASHLAATPTFRISTKPLGWNHRTLNIANCLAEV